MSRMVDLCETSDMFASLQDTEEGRQTLEEVDLHVLYQVNMRVLVMVKELRSVGSIHSVSLSH